METRRTTRSWLIGIALGALAALVLWPGSRWLVRSQLGLALTGSAPATPLPLEDLGIKWLGPARHGTEPGRREIAARHPSDLPLHMAAALEGAPDAVAKVARLRALRARFARSPSLYANILRYCTQGSVVIRRPEGDMLQGDPPPTAPQRQPQEAALAEFDRDAAQGERVDPDNGYFPALRAVGYLAARRDPEGIAALQRAAACSAWREYYGDEVDGMLRADDERYGRHTSLTRVTVMAALLFPHYASLRSAARIAVWDAAEAEKAGRVEEGLAIRRSVLRLGDLMRSQSPGAIGFLVGASMTPIAIRRPGGAPAAKAEPDGHKWGSTEQQVAAYADYVTSIGHPDEAGAVRMRLKAGSEARAIFSSAVDHAVFVAPLFRLLIWWGVSLLALAELIWLAILAAGSGVLATTVPIRRGSGVPGPVRRGLWAGAGLSAAAAVWAAYGPGRLPALASSLPYLLVVLGVLGTGLYVTRRAGAGRLHGGLSFGASAAAFGLAAASLLSVATMVAAMAGSLQGVAIFYNFVVALTDGAGHARGTAQWPWFAGAGLVVAIGWLPALVFAVASRICHVPVGAGVVRGLKHIAPPMAAAVALLYVVTVVGTLRAEQAVNYAAERTMQNECRYMAETVGRTWPVPVK